jgi:hypothetical protein
MRRHNARILTLLLLVAGVAAAQQAPIPATATFTQTQSSGMVGITGVQTARLNLLNLSSNLLNGTTTSCTAQVTFLDDSGATLKTATVTVEPGKSMPVDYPSTTSARQQIRVTIGISHPSVTAPTAGMPVALPIFYCSLVPTLEIFDNSTLKTTFYVSDFHYVLAYPMPLMGVSTGAPPMR